MCDSVCSNVLRFFLSLACIFALCLFAVSSTAPPARSQATQGTGSIQGSVLDPSGGVVSNATVTLLAKDTGRETNLVVTSSGQFNSGPVVPGTYRVKVVADGFKSIERDVVVQIGQVASANLTWKWDRRTPSLPSKKTAELP